MEGTGDEAGDAAAPPLAALTAASRRPAGPGVRASGGIALIRRMIPATAQTRPAGCGGGVGVGHPPFLTTIAPAMRSSGGRGGGAGVRLVPPRMIRLPVTG